MSTDTDLYRLAAELFAEEPPTQAPDALLPGVIRATGRMRPRSRWLALIKEPSMRISSRVAVGSPTLRLASILALTMALILVAAAAVATGASLLPSPPLVPLPLTHNGLIAYGAAQDIWVIHQDGTDPRRLTKTGDVESSPIWSPDGKQLAVWHTANGVTDVEILDADGVVVKTLKASPGYNLPQSFDDHLNLFAAWSPSGDSVAVLAFADGAADIEANGHKAKVQVPLIFDVQTGVGHPLDIGKPVFAGQRWSPDGSLLTFLSVEPAMTTGSMWAVKPDGTGIHQIAKPDSGVGGDNSNSMLADGKSMLVDDYNTQSLEAVALDGTGTPAVVLTSKPGEVSVFASVSPDGQSIAFIREDTGEDLYVVPIDGIGERRLLQDVVNPSPIWSPDGTRLVVRQSSGYKVVTVDDSVAPVPIPLSGDIGVVSWQAVP